MIHINLLPVREVEQAVSRRNELALAGAAVLATLVLVLLAHVFQSGHLHQVSERIAQLEGNLEKIRKQNQELEKLEQQKDDIKEKIRVVKLLTSPERRAAAVHVLDDLSSSIPELLWLTDFTESKSAAKINGRAMDNQTIASFAHNLSNSRYFQKVEIRETVQETPTTAGPQRRGVTSARADNAPPVPVTRFLIEAGINYGPPVQVTPAPEGKEKTEKKIGAGKKTTQPAKEKKK
jgi:type IV pilus assembly protein PilN